MLVEASDDGVLVLDSSGVILAVNPAAERLFGHPSGAMVGLPLPALIPAGARERHGHHFAGFLAHGESARPMELRAPVRACRADGTEFLVEVSLARWQDDGNVRIGAIVREARTATRARQRDRMTADAATRLAESLNLEDTMRTLLELTVERVADWALVDVRDPGDDPEPRIVRRASRHPVPRSDQALRYLEAHGLHWDAPAAAIDAMRNGECIVVDPVTDDWLESRADDPEALAVRQQLAAHALAVLPIGGPGKVIGALTIGLSSPGRRLDADLLEDGAALAALGALAIANARMYDDARRASQIRDRLLRIVSHDLRNPTVAIELCAAGLLRRPDEPEAERTSTYRTIAEAATTIRRLVGDLLDLEAIDAGRFVVALDRQAASPVLAPLREQFASRAAAAGIELRAEIPPDLPAIEADRDRLRQALANLLDNALRFTPAGGAVELRAEPHGGGVRIVVRDTGVGIGPDDLPRLFQPDWQSLARPGGSGLGLPIVQGIVRAHRGTIVARSTPGHGTTFEIVLPAPGE